MPSRTVGDGPRCVTGCTPQFTQQSTDRLKSGPLCPLSLPPSSSIVIAAGAAPGGARLAAVVAEKSLGVHNAAPAVLATRQVVSAVHRHIRSCIRRGFRLRDRGYVELGCSVALVSAAWWPMNSSPARIAGR